MALGASPNSTARSNSAWIQLLRYVLIFIVGAIFSGCLSFVVTCTLVEISTSPFFSFYFGLIFLLIGGLIAHRVSSVKHTDSKVVFAFSFLVMVSGVISFLADSSWFTQAPVGMKVPLFSLLGVSVTFALLFSSLDLINFTHSVCRLKQYPVQPLLESRTQIYLALGTSIVMGFMFGVVFGLLDIEDVRMSHLRMALVRDEGICYPIGALIGGIVACINERLRRRNELHFKPLPNNVICDDFSAIDL